MFEIRADGARPFVVAHRGASGHQPENTMGAFELAVEMGADALECDVHLSADGVPVVIHDETLDRTTKGRGLVRDHSVSQLAQHDVPTLDELLAWCRGRTKMLVELKNGPLYYEGLAAKIAHLVRKHDLLDRAAVISFDHVALRELAQIEPRLGRGALYAARAADPVGFARAASATALLPHWAFATSDQVQLAHAAGLPVSVWTINEPHELRGALAAGVDGLATDYPDRILESLG